MEQCLGCKDRIFFVPLPGEVFTCCRAYGEGVEDIDIPKGVSPAIQKHGLDGETCEKFGEGKSICEISKDDPFSIPPIRQAGEDYLRQQLGY